MKIKFIIPQNELLGKRVHLEKFDGVIKVTLDEEITDPKNGKVVFAKGLDLGIIPEILETNISNLFKMRSWYKGIIKENELLIMTMARLHGHTEYSLLDGMIKIKSLVVKTEWAGAITDHGVMYGVIEYYKKMTEAGKKPILGFEAYCEDMNGDKKKNHLVLLAKNRTGFNNLIKLTTFGHTNIYKKPQISWAKLKEHSEGVIVLSACLGGELPRAILRGDLEYAQNFVTEMISIFKDDFYIEIQRHNIGKMEDDLNEELIKLAKLNGVKIVATDDAHYLNPEDAPIHEMQLCMQTQKTMSDPKRWKFPGTGYHVHTSEEMEKLFHDIPEALINTLEVVDKCDLSFKFGQYDLPNFELPEGFTNEGDYLRHLGWQGFEKRFNNKKNINKYNSAEYRERLQFELDTIINMNLSAYFLIVQDFVNWAKDQGIFVGPGRGSACGSLLTFCINITNLDPIPYGLLFERFINPDRVSMAD